MADKNAADLRPSYWLYKFLPEKAIGFAQLARLDRPIGWQLLFWPCIWGLLLAFYSKNIALNFKNSMDLSQHNFLPIALAHYHIFSAFSYFIFMALLFFIGAVVMRGAGCTYNDIVDYKIDAQVARTATRPIPSGRVSRKQAKIFMLLQCFIGLLVLLQLPIATIILGLCSLFIVALYPFMKRISNWPQAVLGLCFNWGVLVGFSAVFNGVSLAAILLYMGAVFWTIGYDTIYAHQDREDDALIGAFSTARLFGSKTKSALVVFYSLTALGFLLSFSLAEANLWAFIGIIVAIACLIWQIMRFDMHNAHRCLAQFKSNHWVGVLITIFAIIGLIL